jgi:hypothetical protein
MDLLGDLGGIIDLLIAILGCFISPFAEMSFLSKAAKKLYYTQS